MADAGKVMILPKGEYSASTQYEKYDMVTLNNVSYIAKKDVMGVEPTDTESWLKWIDGNYAEDEITDLKDNKADDVSDFTVAESFENITNGDKHNTIFGKLAKWFSVLDNKLDKSNNAGAHNGIYRGKNLGSTVTNTQWNSIKNGTFEDLYIGDYWSINNINWRIAAFDYWLNCGDTACTAHHIVIVPDGCLYNAVMNDTNTTAGAYIGSKMYTESLDQAKSTANSAFGSSHILSRREYLANSMKATSNPTYESSGAWYDSTIELMNEQMVYGNSVFHNIECAGAIPTNYTIDKSQLPLFALDPSRICNRASWWLRDAVSAAHFAYTAYNGFVSYNNASASTGVRPVFAIKA